MAINETRRWRATRPRASSDAARVPNPVFAANDALRLKASAPRADDRAWQALDLDLRVVHHAPGRPGTSTALAGKRHLPLRPQQRSRAVTTFADLAARNDVFIAPKPAPTSQRLLPHEAAQPAGAWPYNDLVLSNGGPKRYVLHAEGRVLGANSCLSLCSVHDRDLVLYGVAKTFAFFPLDFHRQDAAAGTRHVAVRAQVEREIGYSLVPGQDLTPDAYYHVYGREGFAQPQPLAAPRGPLLPLHRPASAAAPLALLRQEEPRGWLYHVIYPLQQGDMRQMLLDCALAQQARKLRRRGNEMMGHALLAGALTDLHRLHAVGLYHQDIKVENVLLQEAFALQRGAGAGAAEAAPTAKIRAYLTDFGNTTPNRYGSIAAGTLATHAPEAFMSARMYASNVQGEDNARAGGVGSKYARDSDDIWALGLVLVRALAPHLTQSNPLVPAYHRDVRYVDPATRVVTQEFDGALLDDNYAKAQAYLTAWRRVHAAWLKFYSVDDPCVVPMPHGNVLPTPAGAHVDKVLGHIAGLSFDFLYYVLQMLHPDPQQRPRTVELIPEYDRGIKAASAEPAYRPVIDGGRAQLATVLRGLSLPAAQRQQQLGYASTPRQAPTFAELAARRQRAAMPREVNPVLTGARGAPVMLRSQAAPALDTERTPWARTVDLFAAPPAAPVVYRAPEVRSYGYGAQWGEDGGEVTPTEVPLGQTVWNLPGNAASVRPPPAVDSQPAARRSSTRVR